MKPPVVSEAEAQKASRKSGTWKPGWYPSRIDAALEKVSNAGNDCFELTHNVRNAAGDERTIRDWLTGTNFGLLKLKHAIEAVGASGKYNAGEELSQDDFPGHDVEVRLAIEKKGGFTRNVVVDYRAASSSSSVVNFGERFGTAVKAVAFVGGVVLAASSLTACADIPGASSPVQDDPGPSSFTAQPYAPPQAYAAPYSYQPQPVAPLPQPWGGHDLGNMAGAAGLGVAGGMIANRALSGETAATVGEGAETAAGVGEALTAGRAVGAARAGAAVAGAAEAAEAAEGEAVIEWILERWWLLELISDKEPRPKATALKSL